MKVQESLLGAVPGGVFESARPANECVACKVSGLRRSEAAERAMNNGSRSSGDAAVKGSRVGVDI